MCRVLVIEGVGATDNPSTLRVSEVKGCNRFPTKKLMAVFVKSQLLAGGRKGVSLIQPLSASGDAHGGNARLGARTEW